MRLKWKHSFAMWLVVFKFWNMNLPKNLFVTGILGVLGLASLIGGSHPKKWHREYTGGIAANGYECASIGRDIIAKGGNAVDAAIATLFCEGVTVPHCMGLGGGFLMTIYIRAKKQVIHLNAREVAPLASHEHMFNGNKTLSSTGGLSVAVPGELKGYYEAWKRYGKLPWPYLVFPTLELCKKGHYVTAYLANILKAEQARIMESPTLREIYVDSRTMELYREGDYIKRYDLVRTLKAIAIEGSDALYKGSLTKEFVRDIQENGGIITEEDMHKYKYGELKYQNQKSNNTSKGVIWGEKEREQYIKCWHKSNYKDQEKNK